MSATPAAAPFFREAGAGPGVVCLHSNASSSNQWRSLMELLAPRFHVLAPDMHGAGKGPAWPHDRTIGLKDEAAMLEPVFDAAGDLFVLVAHSYGAAVALVAAATRARRVKALVLYEPTLFALLDAQAPPPNDADGIRAAVHRSIAALEAGDSSLAAEHFIDYWMGRGAWAQTPDARKGPIAASMASVRGWGQALTTEPTPLATFAQLDLPVLLMLGKQSPPSSRSVARLLAAALPRVQVLEFEELGHMGPVTHPDMVNAAIAHFLDTL
jgi:pimeloyl-ACP methyl ester carboxylesterase